MIAFYVGADVKVKEMTADELKRIEDEIVEMDLPSEIAHAANKAVEEGQQYT